MASALTGLPYVEFKRYESSRHCPYSYDPDVPSFSGSFAVVSRYLDADGRQFAVKQVAVRTDVQRSSSADIHQSIESEIGILSICEHPNLLKFIEAYTVDTVNTTRNTVFIVTLPWAPQNLGHFLESVQADSRSDQPWWNSRTSFEKCNVIFSGLLNGLNYLHKHNIMHKDIKPENILLENSRPILADFGVSKLYRASATTQFTKSTVQYLAPEQISHTESSPRADIFAMGCCFSLVYAAAYGGRGAMERILDTVLELPGSCQYGRELNRLMPVIRDITSQPVLMMFLVRDMMMEIPQQRPDCDHLEFVLTTFVDLHQAELESPDAGESTSSDSQSLFDLFPNIGLCASPGCFDNTDAVCTQMLLNSLKANNPLDDSAESVSTISDRSDPSMDVLLNSVRMTIVTEDTQHPTVITATYDTGSSQNFISHETCERIAAWTQKPRNARKKSFTLVHGQMGPLEPIRLDFTLPNAERVFEATFYVVPREIESYFEVLLGSQFMLRNWSLIGQNIGLG